MPNSFLPPIEQGTATTKEGAILIGDSWNMRHPLTGGGMTVALNDVLVLRDLLGSVKDLKDWNQIQKILHRWHWDRKPLASTINILSVALYDLFGADSRFINRHPSSMMLILQLSRRRTTSVTNWMFQIL